VDIEGAREEALEKGKEEGKAEKPYEFVRNLLAMGEPIPKIVQLTGLSSEDLEEIGRQFNWNSGRRLEELAM
jgi:predicted transposase/invertase (TIGR01784 family)